LSQPTYLVTGATGAIGPSVVDALHRAGYQIRTFSLDKPEAGLFPDTVDIRTGDVTDAAAVKAAMRGCDLVMHLAAPLHVEPPQSTLSSNYECINIGGTSTILAAALDARVKRIVFFSTIAVYGSSRGQVFDEDMPTRPESVYARTKLEAERILLDAKQPDGKPLATVLRLAAVYGARIKGNYRRLVQSLARKRFIPIGRGGNQRTLIYDQDVAAAALLAAHHPAAAGKIYNVTDGHLHTLDEIIRAICDALGRKPPRLSLPVRPVRWTLAMLEDWARFFGVTLPIGRATIDKYIEDLPVSGERIQRELGFVPQYDLAAGWTEAILRMRTSCEL
jgi:nucleoside-diphosphate-sugar epimerase